jgi:hypothetical protein
MQSAPGIGSTTKSFKRRSARVQLRIPITIEIGDEVFLEAETVTVSKHGAKIRIMGFRGNQVTHGKLSCGDHMLVVNRSVQKSQKARVVWQDKRAEPHYGIELDDPGNFWGVYFPSKDGNDWRSERKSARAVAVPAAVFPPSTPAEVMPPVSDTPELLEGPAIPALLTGLSAARMPLAEKVDVVFTQPDEASALLHHLVEPGASVRLILPNDRVMMGRVATVGGQRQAGKWRVRIKCEAQHV